MRARALAAACRLLPRQATRHAPQHAGAQPGPTQRPQGQLPWALRALPPRVLPGGGLCDAWRRGLAEKRGVAKAGDAVRIHMQMIRDDQVTILNTRRPGQEPQPLELTIGGQQLPAFIENMCIGMQVGQSKQVKLKAAECFGDINEDLIIQFKNSELPKEAQDQIKPGSEIEAMVNPDSEDSPGSAERKARGTVISHTDDTTTVNFNHPLAGHGHSFALQLISCKPN